MRHHLDSLVVGVEPCRDLVGGDDEDPAHPVAAEPQRPQRVAQFVVVPIPAGDEIAIDLVVTSLSR